MKDPAFLFYTRDWLSSSTVQKMSGEQVKAYVYMLCAAWLEDDTATLPNDEASLAAAARVDLETWRRICPLIMTKWQVADDGRVFNDRQMVAFMERKHRKDAALQREARRREEKAQAEHKVSTSRAQAEHKVSKNHSTTLANANANATAIPKGAKRTLGGRTSC